MTLSKQDILDKISSLEDQYNIPTGAYKQIIQQESSFKPGLTSSAGAYGYAQLMPATAKDMGVDRYDPIQNLEGGAKYYSSILHNQAKGDPAVAAAMYNSGPNAKFYKTNDIRMMPLETRNYFTRFKNEYSSQVQPSQSQKELTPEEFAALPDTQSQKELTPEEFAALPDTQSQKELTPEEFAALPDTVPEIPTNKISTGETSQIPKRTFGLDLLKETALNIPGSAVKLGAGTLSAGINAITHPVETAKGLGNIGKGAAQLTGEHFGVNLGSDEAAKQAFTNFAETMANRYGNKQALFNTIATDPVGFTADISSFGALSKAGLLPARSTVELVPHPVSSISDLTLKGVGKSITKGLETVNKSSLTKEEINRAYNAGLGKKEPQSGQLDIFQQTPSFKNTVMDKPLLPKWNEMSDAEKLSLMGTAGYINPGLLAAFSPKLVSGAAYTAGLGRRIPAGINKAIDVTPYKGILNQYENEQQNNPIKNALNQVDLKSLLY